MAEVGILVDVGLIQVDEKVLVTLGRGQHALQLLDKRLPPAETCETVRLKFLADNLKVKCTPVDNWVLNIKCATRGINDSSSRACVMPPSPSCTPPPNQCPTR